MKVDQTLVDLELVTVPGLRTLTARLRHQRSVRLHRHIVTWDDTNRLASGDLEDLSGKTDGPLDAELLVLRAVDEVRRDCPADTSASAHLHSLKHGVNGSTHTSRGS